MLAATPRALGLDEPRLDSYYRRIADWILPHVVDRPLGLLRSLSEGEVPFFQKHAKTTSPSALLRIPIVEGDTVAEHLSICDREGLFSLASIEVLEIHTWGSKRAALDRPDRLVFDLDPGPDVSWREIVEAAILVERALEERGLAGFPMLTGSRGIHLLCPLIPRADWTEARSFAAELVDRMVAQFPSRFIAGHSMAERAGRIFIDSLRNDWGATSIAPYTTRARRGAPVAAPTSWEELEETSGPAMYDVRSMPERLDSIARDPWQEFWKIEQSL
jgi:bifunctional non-homologous end joining protein LigD